MSYSWVRRPDAVVESEEDGEKRREGMRQSYNNDPVYFYNSRGGIIVTMTTPCDVCGEEMVSDFGGYWRLHNSYDIEDLQHCIRFNKPLPKRIRMYFRDEHYCDDMRFLKNPRVCGGYTDEEDFHGCMCDDCNADYWMSKGGTA